MAGTVINPRSLVQVLNLDKDVLKLQTPFSMSISGPSQVRISNSLIFGSLSARIKY